MLTRNLEIWASAVPCQRVNSDLSTDDDDDCVVRPKALDQHVRAGELSCFSVAAPSHELELLRGIINTF